MELLKECLTALEKLHYPRSCYELIVVDDGSSDATPQFLKEFLKKTEISFTYYSQSNQGPASARNFGVMKSRFSFTAFVDDDCIPHEDWLNELMKGFTDETVAGVGGSIKSSGKGLLSDYMSHHGILRSNPQGDEFPPYLITANACFKKKILELVKGFDGHIRHPGGEDPDLGWRISILGYRFNLNEKAIVYHQYPESFHSFFQRFYFYGQGHRYLEMKHGYRQIESISLFQEFRQRKILLPHLFFYRIKEYITIKHLNWRKAIAFAALSFVRELVWLLGYCKKVNYK